MHKEFSTGFLMTSRGCLPKRTPLIAMRHVIPPTQLDPSTADTGRAAFTQVCDQTERYGHGTGASVQCAYANSYAIPATALGKQAPTSTQEAGL